MNAWSVRQAETTIATEAEGMLIAKVDRFEAPLWINYERGTAAT